MGSASIGRVRCRGEALKCLAQGIDLVIDDIGANSPETNTIVMAEFAQPQEAFRSPIR
jgi:hypothetical protein